MPKSSEPRKKRRIAINVDLHQWIEEQIRNGKFENFSDAVEIALERLRNPEKEQV